MASSAASVTLNGASSTANGTTADFTKARSRVTMVVGTSGTVTDGLVALQGSHDTTAWANVGFISPTTGMISYVSSDSVAFRYWRGSVVIAIAGGGTVRATLMYSDAEDGVL